MNIADSIGFDVEFNFTGIPAIILTANTTIPSLDKPNLTGYFSVTQPDGITTTGDHTSIAWDGAGYPAYSVPLRMGADQKYQKGVYTIIFYAACTGYTSGLFSRMWSMDYKPVTQTFTDGFDCFTPSLKYTDSTNYQVGGYSITGQSSAWQALSLAGNPTGSAAEFDLAISGNYYDSTYAISYTKLISYLNTAYSWLTVEEKITAPLLTKKASIPASMATMLTYLVNIKTQRDAAKGNCNLYDDLDELFEDANSLYQLMRTRVCAQNTTGLITTFDEYLTLVHNNQPQIYINTNGVIPAYNFTAGCSGAGASVFSYSIRPAIGASSFTISALAGKNILTATRSGFTKAITTVATADMEFLQIVGNVITLPIGSTVSSVTLPDNSEAGELFTFTYS